MEKLIQANPAIMRGKPTISGTRITVDLILEKLAAGESPDQLLEAHLQSRPRRFAPRWTSPRSMAALCPSNR